MSSPDEFLANN